MSGAFRREGRRRLLSSGDLRPKEPIGRAIEIAYNPGVMDPVEESALKGIRDLGIAQVQAVRRARRYLLYGNIPAQDLEIITSKVLSNKLIQHVVTDPASKNFPFCKTKRKLCVDPGRFARRQ